MDHKQLWHSHSEDTRERLRLLDFVHPESQALKPVIAVAKARMREITKRRWGRTISELSAYVPPSEWANDPTLTIGKWVSWEVEALYETLHEQKISYAVEKWDSTVHEQVIRTPEQLLAPGELGGPCIDLVLLFAACLECVNLHPLIVVIGEPSHHAILGYWLGERPFSKSSPAKEVHPLFFDRTAFESEQHRQGFDVDFIECTGLTVGDDWPFDKARKEGKKWAKQPIKFCLDVKTARETVLARGIQAYLRAVREQLGRLPQMWYPPSADFSRARVCVQVRQGRRPYNEAEERKRELRRRQGLAGEEKQSLYKWRGSPDEWKTNREEAARPLDWDREVRMRLQRGVILGDPGFGKTWLLRHEGWRMAGESLQKLRDFPLAFDEIELPIYVRLAELGNIAGEPEDALIKLLSDNYGISEKLQDWIRETLSTNRCLLLLDGLDEVPVEDAPREPKVGYRNELYGRLKRFAENHQCRIWLVSRIVGYQGSPFHLTGNERQGELELLPFDRKQQEDFAKAWFASQSEVADRFLRELGSSAQIRGLGQVPLLLAMLCKTYGSNQHQLPTRRAKLYETCLNGLLLGEWRDSKASDTYQRVKREFIEELAYQLFDRGMELFAFEKLRVIAWEILESQPKLRADLGRKGARELIDELSEEDGLLIKAGTGENPPYLFLHLTFQEYLTACALARRTELERVDGEEVPKWLGLVKPHFFNPRWEEVILLLASKLDDTAPLLQAIWNEPEDIVLGRLVLAGSCLAQARRADPRFAKEISNEFIAWVGGMGGVIPAVPVPPGTLCPWDALSVSTTASCFLQTLGTLAASHQGCFRSLIREVDTDGSPALVVALGKSGRSEALPVLLRILMESDDHFARVRALVALARIGTDNALIAVCDFLTTSSDTALRELAAEILGRHWLTEAEPHLIPLLADPEEAIVETVVRVLGRIGDDSAVVRLLALIRDPRSRVREAVAKALGELACKESRPALLNMLADCDHSVRIAAAQALRHVANDVTVPGILELIQARPESTQAALIALGEIATEQALDALLEMTRGSAPFVRDMAAAALGETNSGRAIPSLIRLLQDESTEVRFSAAAALAHIGDRSALYPLLKLLQGGPQYVPAPAHQMVDVRATAAWALGEIGDPAAVPDLEKLLAAGSVSLACTAAQALIKLGSEAGLPAVLEHLWNPWQESRREAARALGEMKREEAVFALLEHTRDSSPIVRGTVFAALRKIGSKLAIPTLFDMAAEGREGREALESLVHISRQHRVRILLDGSYTKVG